MPPLSNCGHLKPLTETTQELSVTESQAGPVRLEQPGWLAWLESGQAAWTRPGIRQTSFCAQTELCLIIATFTSSAEAVDPSVVNRIAAFINLKKEVSVVNSKFYLILPQCVILVSNIDRNFTLFDLKSLFCIVQLLQCVK